eukprot:CAMPEP_0196661612 /NCGR_PEP_ID=MMETSP1086-20130531/45191_1 /TAXON_ID=77921 /ORGANISM="Cyanoptyche  gloeocystis , Strain SAG4.97" /LENGTH=146 /DNA_ID=CAMNT_0041996599 /DNA_START=78 /DNA_END=516 /DNA_ORIENTATION=-
MNTTHARHFNGKVTPTPTATPAPPTPPASSAAWRRHMEQQSWEGVMCDGTACSSCNGWRQPIHTAAVAAATPHRAHVVFPHTCAACNASAILRRGRHGRRDESSDEGRDCTHALHMAMQRARGTNPQPPLAPPRPPSATSHTCAAA